MLVSTIFSLPKALLSSSCTNYLANCQAEKEFCLQIDKNQLECRYQSST